MKYLLPPAVFLFIFAALPLIGIGLCKASGMSAIPGEALFIFCLVGLIAASMFSTSIYDKIK